MDLTPDETDDDSGTEAPSGELELENLLDQLQAVQLQAPFESTRYKLRKSWTKTINYFHPQRRLIAAKCVYVAENFEGDVKFSFKLFKFSRILKRRVHWTHKEATILQISEQWSILKPMIKKHLESDTLGERIKNEMHEILFNMKQYKKYHSKIFDRNGVQAKTDIQDDSKKSKSTKTQTKETYDEISRHKRSFSPGRTRDKKSSRQHGFPLKLYSPKRHRQKKNEKQSTKRDNDSDSDSSDSSSSSDGD
jgi:hypothetical protein